jgi:hypothetical protein
MKNPLSNPLLVLHRSIFDPSIYRETAAAPLSAVLLFVVFLTLLTAIIGTVANTVYFLDPVKGFAPALSRVLKDVRFVDGQLVSDKATPRLPDQGALREAMVLMFGMPEVMQALPDSFVVIDTGKGSPRSHNSTVAVELTRDKFVLHTTASLNLTLPYSTIIGKRKNLVLDEATIQRGLVRNVVAVLVHFGIQNLFITTLNMLFSLLFLTLAGYILLPRRPGKAQAAFWPACLAVSPVAVGSSLEAVSGAHVVGTWYIFMLIASIVLMRGIKATGPASPAVPGSE